MSEQIIIEWANFGFHMGIVRSVKRVKTPTGGTAIANMGVEGKVSHRNFLTKEEAEVLVEATGLLWRHSTPKQIASDNFGKYTLEVNYVGRFFTDHKVGEIAPCILPAEVVGAGRSFTPIVAYKRIEKKPITDVSPTGNVQVGGKAIDGVRPIPAVEIADQVGAEPIPVERQLEAPTTEASAGLQTEQSEVPSNGLLDGNQEGLVIDEEPIVDNEFVPSDDNDSETLYKD